MTTVYYSFGINGRSEIKSLIVDWQVSMRAVKDTNESIYTPSILINDGTAFPPYCSIAMRPRVYWPDSPTRAHTGLWLELTKSSSPAQQTPVKVELRILRSRGSPKCRVFANDTAVNVQDMRRFGDDKFIDFQALHNPHNGYLVGYDLLKVQAEINFACPFHMTSLCDLSRDLLAFRNSPDNCDFTLVDGEGHRHPINKQILTIRIPFLHHVLHDTHSTFRERLTNEYTLPEVDTDTMVNFVNYIYGSENIDDKADTTSLYDLSEQYQLSALRRIVDRHLTQNLSPKNLLSTLQLAVRYQTNVLKKAALDYIQTHRNSISVEMKTELIAKLGNRDEVLGTQIAAAIFMPLTIKKRAPKRLKQEAI